MTQASTAQDWASARERSNRWALRILVWIALRLGRPAARAVLHPIAAYFLATAPAARRHSRRYLARALGREPTWAERYRHVHRFACVALDRLYLARGALGRFELEVVGGPVIDGAIERQGGAFLLGAHLGSFEVLNTIGASRPGMRVAMVMYPDNARQIQGVLQAVAPDQPLTIIPIGRPGSTLRIRDWLDQGGLVGLMGDRHPPGTADPVPGIAHDFLGVPATWTDGPMRLAMLLRREVVFMVGLYHGGSRYEIRFETMADFREVPADPAAREAAVAQAVAAYAARLDALCRAHPFNWFNFYDFWREDRAR